MYQRIWGLRQSPFDGAGTSGFFRSSTHTEALARMGFLVEQQRRLGAFVGARGTGKSLTLETFAKEMRRKGRQVALLGMTGLTGNQMAWEAAEQLGLAPEKNSVGTIWRDLRDHFQENTVQGIGTVVLIDDLDGADSECLEVVRRLSEIDVAQRSMLTLIASMPEGNPWRSDDWLGDATDLWVSLDALSAEESEEYIAFRWEHAGGAEHPFEADAIARIHCFTGGVARRLNQLCDLLLVTAACQGINQITGRMVEEVYGEMFTPWSAKSNSAA